MQPYLVPSLKRLRAEVDILWPNRSRVSDGWLGDAAHQLRSSDHNPDEMGRVHALDVTAKGVDNVRLVVAVTHHPGVAFVIYRGFLYSQHHGFRPVTYEGADPHISHVHISVRHTTSGRRDPSPWLS